MKNTEIKKSRFNCGDLICGAGLESGESNIVTTMK
jgi:hypothetical protein